MMVGTASDPPPAAYTRSSGWNSIATLEDGRQ